jgi:hypothetical protein
MIFENCIEKRVKRRKGSKPNGRQEACGDCDMEKAIEALFRKVHSLNRGD